jgi:4-amino-4-deoxy-L-arabinose transferase-like glycosyltransferase
METLITISNFLIFGLIVISPILLLRLLKKKSQKRIAIKLFLIGVFLMALLIIAWAAWADISNLILLNHYGYSIDGMNYKNVLPENRERVDRLVTSIMGIGWPLKALFGFVLTIPYLIFIYIGSQLIDITKKLEEKDNQESLA